MDFAFEMKKQPYRQLFSPFCIGNMMLQNRVVMMPMGTNFALETGGISERHIHYYEQRARGGTGLIVVENVCVDFPLGSNGTTQLRFDNDQFIPGMARLCEAIHRHGCRVAVQLNHAGASALFSRTGMVPVSSSDVPSKKGGEIPRPMEEEEMFEIAKKFGDAAYRAKTAGFDAVELHAGHSYLLSQFLSPTMNHRTDKYGGPPENRARFPQMVMEEIRSRVGKGYPIFLRISLEEFVKGGNTMEDSLELLRYFGEEADVFSVSAGLNGSLQYQIDLAGLPDGWRSYMAKAVREKFGKPTITMGNIRSPKVAEEILERGDADLIGIGRGLIAEPEWVNKVQGGHEKCLRNCISCNVGCAGNRIGKNRPIRCTVNPTVDVGEDYKKLKIKKPCNVVVIGGGIAGMEAACTAAEVGCTVTLIERGKQLGGLISQLVQVSKRFRMHDYLQYMIHRAMSLRNLAVLTGIEATSELVARFHPDLIVNATGSKAMLPAIPGLHEALATPGAGVFTIKSVLGEPSVYQENLEGKQLVVIGGGSAGVDAIEFFAKSGANVTIVEKGSVIGSDIDPISRCNLTDNLQRYNVTVCTNTTLRQMLDHEILVDSLNGREIIPFDYAYICMGMEANAPLLQELQEQYLISGVDLLNIGDSAGARGMINSVQEGHNILTRLSLLGFLEEREELYA